MKRRKITEDGTGYAVGDQQRQKAQENLRRQALRRKLQRQLREKAQRSPS